MKYFYHHLLNERKAWIWIGFTLMTFGLVWLRAEDAQENIASPAQIEEKISSPVGFELYGWSYGPSFGKWDNGNVPGAAGTADRPSAITTQAILTLPMTQNFKLSVIPMFDIAPFTSNDKFVLYNPTVGFQGDLIKAGGFSWWARFEMALPLTESSRTAGMILGPQSVMSLKYAFSNIEAETVLVPSITFYNQSRISNYLYVSPRLFYIFNDSWRLVALMESHFTKDAGKDLSEFNTMRGSNLGIGFRKSWQGGDYWIQPFVNLYPFGRVAADSVFAGFFFNARLL